MKTGAWIVLGVLAAAGLGYGAARWATQEEASPVAVPAGKAKASLSVPRPPAVGSPETAEISCGSVAARQADERAKEVPVVAERSILGSANEVKAALAKPSTEGARKLLEEMERPGVMDEMIRELRERGAEDPEGILEELHQFMVEQQARTKDLIR